MHNSFVHATAEKFSLVLLGQAMKVLYRSYFELRPDKELCMSPVIATV